MVIALTNKEIEWIELLIEDCQEAGKLKPELTLKVIISRIMEKFNCDQNDAIDMCTQVMQNMTLGKK